MKYVALQKVKWDDSTTTKISKTTIFSGKCEQNHQNWFRSTRIYHTCSKII
jgi:hypothetical protein